MLRQQRICNILDINLQDMAHLIIFQYNIFFYFSDDEQVAH